MERRQLSWQRGDRVDGLVGGDLLDRLTATDCLHGTPGLELGAVARRLLIDGSPDYARAPSSEVKDRAFPGKPDHLTCYPNAPKFASFGSEGCCPNGNI